MILAQRPVSYHYHSTLDDDLSLATQSVELFSLSFWYYSQPLKATRASFSIGWCLSSVPSRMSTRLQAAR